MKQEEYIRITDLLREAPEGQLEVIRHVDPGKKQVLPTDAFSARTAGKGRIENYPVLPGIDASYCDLLAPQVEFHHPASRSVLELFYCRSGRVGWNMQGGAAIYLGAGDLVVHSTFHCADSAMMLPLGYAQGLSIAMDLDWLERDCPAALQRAGVNFAALRRELCEGEPLVVPACVKLEQIFAPLYAAPAEHRAAYLQLKSQELLLYLLDFRPEQKALTQYFSQQTERIREIHRQLTEHLDRRFTIEELSKQYLINTSTLKSVFKAVYGLPIARYMKEYRVRRAMQMLRESEDAISNIANQLGYETQGKFSEAFKDVAQMLPSEYRKLYRDR